MKSLWLSVATIAIGFVSGCQFCPLTDYYGNAVDSVNDTHVYFDRVYNPRFDLTRIGKPDWCGPFNRLFCQRGCVNGCYDRYDDCNLYPPLTPTTFPSSVMPPPTYRTARVPRPVDVQLEQSDEDSPVVPSTTPQPAPAPKEL